MSANLVKCIFILGLGTSTACGQNSFSGGGSGGAKKSDNGRASSGNQYTYDNDNPGTWNTNPPLNGPPMGAGYVGQTATVEDCFSNSVNKVTETYRIKFPATAGCRWGVDGNLGEDGNRYSARNHQVETVQLPQGAKLCAMKSYNSVTSSLEFDDLMILLVENYLLVGSGTSILPRLNQQDGLYLYDWDKIKGMDWGSGEDDNFCAGSGQCTFPTHDDEGRVSVSLDDQTTRTLTKLLFGQNKVSFSAIPTGDNEDNGCYHSGLEVDVELEYLPSGAN